METVSYKELSSVTFNNSIPACTFYPFSVYPVITYTFMKVFLWSESASVFLPLGAPGSLLCLVGWVHLPSLGRESGLVPSPGVQGGFGRSPGWRVLVF